jgi:hypothetical protein
MPGLLSGKMMMMLLRLLLLLLLLLLVLLLLRLRLKMLYGKRLILLVLPRDLLSIKLILVRHQME